MCNSSSLLNEYIRVGMRERTWVHSCAHQNRYQIRNERQRHRNNRFIHHSGHLLHKRNIHFNFRGTNVSIKSTKRIVYIKSTRIHPPQKNTLLFPPPNPNEIIFSIMGLRVFSPFTLVIFPLTFVCLCVLGYDVTQEDWKIKWKNFCVTINLLTWCSVHFILCRRWCDNVVGKRRWNFPRATRTHTDTAAYVHTRSS